MHPTKPLCPPPAQQRRGQHLPAPVAPRCGEGIPGQSGAGMLGMFLGTLPKAGK